MGYFCCGCNVVFEPTEIVLDIKAEDGNEFYHKSCYHGNKSDIIRELKPDIMYRKAHCGNANQRGKRARIRSEKGHAQILEIIEQHGLVTAAQIQAIQTSYTVNGLYSVLRILVKKELITKTRIDNRTRYAIKASEIVSVELHDNLSVSGITN